MSSSTTTIPEDWSTLQTINPEFAQLLETLPPNSQLVSEKTTIASLRGPKRHVSTPLPDVKERDLMVKMRDGFENRIRVYNHVDEKEGENEGGALLVMIHGGGFCVGSLEQEEGNCRIWVKEHRGVAVSIDHRLAPEYKWPIGLEDCWDVVRWVARNHKDFNADPKKGFVVGGTSSGALMSMTISHLARDENFSPPLTGVFVSVGCPCVPAVLPEPWISDPRLVSYEQNKDAPLFSRASTEFFASHLNADPLSPLRSPLLNPKGFANLPPHYFQIAGYDSFRDYGLLYEELLRKEGTRTLVHLFPGLIHVFWGFFPKSNFTKDWKERCGEGLGFLFEGGTRGE